MLLCPGFCFCNVLCISSKLLLCIIQESLCTRAFILTFCFAHFVVCPCYTHFSYFNAIWITKKGVQWIVHILNRTFVSCSFCGLSIQCSLLFSMHNKFLGGEFGELSTYRNKCPCLAHFVVCVCHALLLISMHCDFPCFTVHIDKIKKSKVNKRNIRQYWW